MTKIFCQNTDCINFDDHSWTCKSECVTIGEEFLCSCDEYKSYRDSSEYLEKHFIAVRAYDSEGNKVAARALEFGKRIEYKGVIFFTRDRVREDDSHRLTHEKTGYDVGTMSQLKDRWEKFVEKAKELPDIESLPLAMYDRNKYKYYLVEKENDK